MEGYLISNFLDLTGQKYGKLTVLQRAENKGKHTAWLCKCDCGNEKIVQANHLREASVRTCGRCSFDLPGCTTILRGNEAKRHQKRVAKDVNKPKPQYPARRAQRIQGESRSRLYRSVWNKIRQRCLNPKNKDYPHYGGRGISICQEWNDFLVFKEWAYSHGYDPDAPYGKCTLDRIDVNGNYCPDNCRFVDIKTQNGNKTTSHYVTYHGETHTIAEWGEITGLSPNALYNRINRGWELERTFSQPVRTTNRRKRND